MSIFLVHTNPLIRNKDLEEKQVKTCAPYQQSGDSLNLKPSLNLQKTYLQELLFVFILFAVWPLTPHSGQIL